MRSIEPVSLSGFDAAHRPGNDGVDCVHSRKHHFPRQLTTPIAVRHVGLIDRMRALKSARARRVGRRQKDRFHKWRAAAARTRRAGARSRCALHRAVDASRLHVRRAGCEQSVPGGGVIAGIGFVSGIRCMVSANWHRRRRAAALRPRQDDPRPGARAGEQAALRATRCRRQSLALPRRGFVRAEHISYSRGSQQVAGRHRHARFVHGARPACSTTSSWSAAAPVPSLPGRRC